MSEYTFNYLKNIKFATTNSEAIGRKLSHCPYWSRLSTVLNLSIDKYF